MVEDGQGDVVGEESDGWCDVFEGEHFESHEYVGGVGGDEVPGEWLGVIEEDDIDLCIV